MNVSDVLHDAALLTTGKKPNLKFALWIAAMSPLQQLTVNGHMARVLAKYVNKPLPENQEELYYEVKQVQGSKLFVRQRLALYAIETWYNEKLYNGTLAHYERLGDTYESQCNWRDNIVNEIFGVGNKCVSFAALIYSPFTCQLIALDRHHLKRLGYEPRSIAKNENYKAIEKLLINEQSDCELDVLRSLPLALYAWFVWEQYRQKTGASKAIEGAIESHYDLSCCRY